MRREAWSYTSGPQQNVVWGAGSSLPSGWVPADIGAATIRWIRVGSQPPADVFFDKWVATLRSRVPPAREHETELQSLSQSVTGLSEVEPSGIILHVSRCGSTLLSNALAVAENVLTLNEASAFETMIGLAGHSDPFSAAAGARALRDLCKVFGHYRGSSTQQLVVKTGMATVVMLRAIRAVWPDVPCVMIIRDPVQVVVSNLQTPPKVLPEWYDAPSKCFAGSVPEEALGRGIEEFCAWLIGRICSAALEQMDDRCMLLDYQDLTPDAALRVAEFFSLRLTADQTEALRGTFLFDAKHGDLFKPDVDRKKKAAKPSIVEAVARWALDPYEALLRSEWRLSAR